MSLDWLTVRDVVLALVLIVGVAWAGIAVSGTRHDE